MGTSIVPPRGGPTGPAGGYFDQIDQAFGRAYGMLGNAGQGGGFGPGGVSPQPIEGDSLTQFWRGLSNLAGTSVPGFLQAGGNLLGTGTGVTQGGLGLSGVGFGTTQEALKTLQPSIDYYNKLLSGDPAAMTQALSPEADLIAKNTAMAADLTSRGGAQGGLTASTQANLPYAQAAQIGNAALALRPGAAQGLERTSAAQAGIGAEQAGIGQGVSQTGLGLGQLGTVLTGQGLQTLQNTIADVLSKMGI